MVWKNYGMIADGRFYFHGGPLGLNWEVGSLTTDIASGLNDNRKNLQKISSL